jgi:amino acid transporter
VDYLIPGILGFLVGAILFGLTYGQIFPLVSRIASLGAVYLPDLFNVSHWLIIAFFALFAAYLFYILSKTGDPREDRVEA